jgi:hypothetical protein
MGKCCITHASASQTSPSKTTSITTQVLGLLNYQQGGAIGTLLGNEPPPSRHLRNFAQTLYSWVFMLLGTDIDRHTTTQIPESCAASVREQKSSHQECVSMA